MYHIASAILAPGSIINPGDWGRMLRLYQVGQADITNLLRETILENIRSQEFPDKPSRLNSSFAPPGIEAAQFFHTYHHRFGVMYRVRLIDNIR